MFARNFIRAFINTNQNSYNSHQHISNIANNYNIDNKSRFDLINRNNFLLNNSLIEPNLVKKEDVNITFKIDLNLDLDLESDLLRQSLYDIRNFE